MKTPLYDIRIPARVAMPTPDLSILYNCFHFDNMTARATPQRPGVTAANRRV
jgi:hypothetical protein